MNRSPEHPRVTRALRTALILALCASSALSLEACGKKKPPPPPAPVVKPPPPPQPPPVSFDTISQELKADARVQFAPDLKLEDQDVAKAVISLADALARGDSNAVTALVSRPAKPVVDTISAMGGFGDSVEAARVVFVTKNDEQNGFKTSLDDVNRMFSGEEEAVKEADRKITADVAKQIGSLMAMAFIADAGEKPDFSQFTPPMTAEKLQKFKEQWEKLRADASKAALVEQIAALLAGSSMVPGLKDAEYLTLIAVQTPQGTELTGWGLEKAFGKWMFHPASTDGQVKKSAAEWDGVGLSGFSADSTKGIQIAKAKPEGDPANPDKPAEGDAKDKPADGSNPPADNNDPGKQQTPPGEKRTPNGPVKIPGGG
jgi:hypothetical protein